MKYFALLAGIKHSWVFLPWFVASFCHLSSLGCTLQLLPIFTIFINYSGFLTIVCHKLSSWQWHSHPILPFHIHFNKNATSVNMKHLGADWLKNELLQNNKNIWAAWWWDSQEAQSKWSVNSIFDLLISQLVKEEEKSAVWLYPQNYTKHSEFNILTPENDN